MVSDGEHGGAGTGRERGHRREGAPHVVVAMAVALVGDERGQWVEDHELRPDSGDRMLDPDEPGRVQGVAHRGGQDDRDPEREAGRLQGPAPQVRGVDLEAGEKEEVAEPDRAEDADRVVDPDPPEDGRADHDADNQLEHARGDRKAGHELKHWRAASAGGNGTIVRGSCLNVHRQAGQWQSSSMEYGLSARAVLALYGWGGCYGAR